MNCGHCGAQKPSEHTRECPQWGVKARPETRTVKLTTDELTQAVQGWCLSRGMAPVEITFWVTPPEGDEGGVVEAEVEVEAGRAIVVGRN